MNTPIDPGNVRALEQIWTTAWRNADGVRQKRAEAALAAVARALVPSGYTVTPADTAPDPEPVIDLEGERRYSEQRRKRGW